MIQNTNVRKGRDHSWRLAVALGVSHWHEWFYMPSDTEGGEKASIFYSLGSDWALYDALGLNMLCWSFKELRLDNYMSCSLPLKQRKDKKSSVLGWRLVRQVTMARLWLCLHRADVINIGGPGELGGDCANFLCACSLGLHKQTNIYTCIQTIDGLIPKAFYIYY